MDLRVEIVDFLLDVLLAEVLDELLLGLDESHLLDGLSQFVFQLLVLLSELLVLLCDLIVFLTNSLEIRFQALGCLGVPFLQVLVVLVYVVEVLLQNAVEDLHLHLGEKLRLELLELLLALLLEELFVVVQRGYDITLLLDLISDVGLVCIEVLLASGLALHLLLE